MGWVWSPRSLGRTPRGAGWPMRSDPSASGAQPSRAKWLLGAGFSFCKRMTTAPCNPFWWLWWLCAGMGLAPNLPRAYALGGVGGETECCFLQTVRKHSMLYRTTELPGQARSGHVWNKKRGGVAGQRCVEPNAEAKLHGIGDREGSIHSTTCGTCPNTFVLECFLSLALGICNVLSPTCGICIFILLRL